MPKGEIITITGHMGMDPKPITKDGRTIGLKFSVAVGHSRKNKQTGQWENTHTNWYTIQTWGHAMKAVLAMQLKKGSLITVTTKELVARTYIGKDGNAAVELQISAWDGDIAKVLYTPKEQGGYSGGGYSGGYSGDNFAQQNSAPQAYDAMNGGSLRDEAGFNDEFPLDFSEIGGADEGAADVDIPF